MKIMIMTDMEGCAGILNHDDWVMPEGRYYEKGKRFLTEEVNAAIAGFFDAGADEVVVVDGHGYGGIDPELLDERALLSRGAPKPVWPWGLDKTFDALVFVGQHAKAGTPYSHITHTGWFSCIDVTINGISIGEYGNMALCAMELGIPTILACGEQALAEEAEALTPGVITVSVKHGILPDGLDSLDCDSYRKAKLSAIHLSPLKARKLIKEGAFNALLKLKREPEAFSCLKLMSPYVLETKFRASGKKPPHVVRHEHPDSIIELFNMS
ncbi:MAG: M55 family metallopeptidase [Victivallaceae bacterium]|jgi:D-amino peptidase